MDTIREKLSALIVGLYAWLIAIFFGAVWLDTVYTGLLPADISAYSEVSDILLVIGALTVIAAVGAIAFTWKSNTARNFLIASLVILLLEFIIPLLFPPLIEALERSGTLIRLSINGLASLLAMLGMYAFYSHR